MPLRVIGPIAVSEVRRRRDGRLRERFCKPLIILSETGLFVNRKTEIFTHIYEAVPDDARAAAGGLRLGVLCDTINAFRQEKYHPDKERM